ncbi:hypothetical protein Tco_1424252, partial [Tanacetum coccineum]
MKVLTAIFSGELYVGVMLDNKTLLQTGICHANILDALGFTLESNELQAEDLPMVPLSATPKPFSRYSLPPQIVANQLVIQQKALDSPVKNSRNIMKSDHGMSIDSRAL